MARRTLSGRGGVAGGVKASGVMVERVMEDLVLRRTGIREVCAPTWAEVEGVFTPTWAGLEAEGDARPRSAG